MTRVSGMWCVASTSMEVLLDILEVRSKQVYDELVRANVKEMTMVMVYSLLMSLNLLFRTNDQNFQQDERYVYSKLLLRKGRETQQPSKKPAFVLTCKQFGMGQLVDTDALMLLTKNCTSRKAAVRELCNQGSLVGTPGG